MKAEFKRLNPTELDKLRKMDFREQSGFVKAENYLSTEVGAPGTKQRNELDAKARAWYYGEILRERRIQLGITQKELAEQIGKERTYVNRIEKGETDMQLSSLITIADALGGQISLEFDVV